MTCNKLISLRFETDADLNSITSSSIARVDRTLVHLHLLVARRYTRKVGEKRLMSCFFLAYWPEGSDVVRRTTTFNAKSILW